MDTFDLVSCDPAKSFCTLAWWRGRKLVEVTRENVINRQAREGVFELPRYYPGSVRSIPNDLIDVAASAIRVGGFARSWELVPPDKWKGQTPKAINHIRILEALTLIEQGILRDAASRLLPEHDVYDAVGIGLWRLNRMKKLRNPA